MFPWFIWKNQNSDSNGLWISKLPPITRAQERTQDITVPGRAGVLTMKQGEDVYDPVLRKCTVTARNAMNLQPLLDWLRGEGELIFSNEIDMVYHARISAEVAFARISPDLCQAQIQFLCEPFKGHRHADKDKVTMTAAGTVHNPGDVASKPIVKVTGANSNCTVTIGTQAMTFNSLNETITVDCGAQLVLKADGTLWGGTFEGAFWKIPKGESAVTIGNATQVEIQPEWRWV